MRLAGSVVSDVTYVGLSGGGGGRQLTASPPLSLLPHTRPRVTSGLQLKMLFPFFNNKER